MAESENFYEIEDILDHRMRFRKKEYLVKWKGCDSNSNSWVTRENFTEGVVEEYEENLRKKNSPVAAKVFLVNKIKGRLTAWVKFHGKNVLYRIPTEVTNVKFPKLMIEYYQERSIWRDSTGEPKPKPINGGYNYDEFKVADGLPKLKFFCKKKK